MVDAIQHLLDFPGGHFPLIIYRLGGAVATGVTEYAAKIAFVGDSNFREYGQGGEMTIKGFHIDGRMPAVSLQISFQETPDAM